MKTRLMTLVGIIGLIVGIGWYVSAQETAQPTFSAGQILTANDLNTMSNGISTNTSDIDMMQGTSHQADVLTFQNPDGSSIPEADQMVTGSATLVRTDNGIRVEVNTTELDAGAAYTNWWIIFNNPQACGADECGVSDFGNAAVEASAVYATGRVADSNGNAVFRAFLPVGLLRLNRTADGRERHRLGPGLQEPATAVIHYVIRNHGPASASTPDLLEQLSTFEGGCDGFTCFNQQVIIFPTP